MKLSQKRLQNRMTIKDGRILLDDKQNGNGYKGKTLSKGINKSA